MIEVLFITQPHASPAYGNKSIQFKSWQVRYACTSSDIARIGPLHIIAISLQEFFTFTLDVMLLDLTYF